MKTAAVVGSGFGGLALAIRLQSAGIATTVFEARDKPGGRAYAWEKDGFTFDAGPTVITDPDCLDELWSLSGRSLSDDVTLMPVMPFYRLNWPDGTSFDYSNDDEALMRAIARLEPEDVEGYKRFLTYSSGVYEEGYRKLGHVAFLDFASMIKAAPALARYQAWRSVYSIVSGYVKNEKLREALSFHTLLVGGNPMTASAIYALIHKLEKEGGVWFAKGGTHALIRGMVTHFERLGGTIRLGETVKVGYVDQSRDSLAADKSVWQEISGDSETIALGSRQVNSRAYVARFNFHGADQQKKVGNLSGGERNRVHLAKMLKEGANVLLLDEPTNDLDVNTMRALEEALENFAGCAVIISHDRWFLDRIATHILAFEGDSQTVWFEGNYSDYEADRRARLGKDADQPHRIKYRNLTR